MNKSIGTIYLVGAGPGDPELITVKGLRHLREADVILYDRLVDARLLSEAKKKAKVIYVGKDPTNANTIQENIYTMLIDQARQGKQIVRLKGGDPFVFGRGGEEAQILRMAGIPFQIVPGVSSAIAAPAYAGIPVTHREAASYFTVVSAQEDSSKGQSTIPWKSLAQTKGTLVILMGWATLDTIVDRLVSEGMDTTTPAALVQWGTESYQQTVTGNLSNIASRGHQANLGPPVVIVVGNAVTLRKQIQWFDNLPLFGKRVLVTRSPQQASTMSQLLTNEGAEPVELPTIHIQPASDFQGVDSSIRKIEQYEWIVFTSTNAVAAFFQRIKVLHMDSRALAPVKICAVGSSTASALGTFGITPNFVPERFDSNAIGDGLTQHGIKNTRVLIPRGNVAPQTLVQELENAGATVEQHTVYHTMIPDCNKEKVCNLIKDGKIDIITFTSSSAVRNFVSFLNGELDLLRETSIAAIGPITAHTVQEFGLKVDILSSEQTVTGLVQALRDHVIKSRAIER